MASGVGKKFINKSENVVEEMVQVCQCHAAVPQRAAWLAVGELTLLCVCHRAHSRARATCAVSAGTHSTYSRAPTTPASARSRSS